MYRKNTSGQYVGFQLVLAASGAKGTGLTVAVRRCLDGTFGDGGGTVTEDGTTGGYKYALAQADTNANNVSLYFSATGAIPICINFLTTAADPTDGVRMGLTALPNAAADAAGGLPISDAGGLDLDGRLDAAVSSRSTFAGGAVASVTGAVGSVTGLDASKLDVAVSSRLAATDYAAPPGEGLIADAVWNEAIADHLTALTTGASLNAAGSAGDPWSTPLPGAYGDGTAGKILGANIDATISSRAIAGDAMTLESGERDAIALAHLTLANGVETGVTVQGCHRLAVSALGGKLSGAATTNIKTRDKNDTKNRIDATVDASGNRTAVTLDLS